MNPTHEGANVQTRIKFAELHLHLVGLESGGMTASACATVAWKVQTMPLIAISFLIIASGTALAEEREVRSILPCVVNQPCLRELPLRAQFRAVSSTVTRQE